MFTVTEYAALTKHQHLCFVKVRGYCLKFGLKGELGNMSL